MSSPGVRAAAEKVCLEIYNDEIAKFGGENRKKSAPFSQQYTISYLLAYRGARNCPTGPYPETPLVGRRVAPLFYDLVARRS